MRAFLGALFCIVVACATGVADEYDDVGLVRLRAELAGMGKALPTGQGVTVSQVEAKSASGWYFLDLDDPQFAGKNVHDRTKQDTSPNLHTRVVAERFYGKEGMAPGVSEVDIYEATDWYERYLMRLDRGGEAPPLFERAQVQNHSWIAYRNSGTPEAESILILRLLDAVIDRDDVVSVVTLNNDADNELPDLLAHAYNVIAVGTTQGDHTAGLTRIDDAGRRKPDLVAPAHFTSFAAPLVSGAAAMLVESAEMNGQSDARYPQVVKAILLAGASKEEFPDWSRSPSQPLDAEFGAGELNIYNSYFILEGGAAVGGTFGSDGKGWVYDTAGGGETMSYEFEVQEDMLLTDLSVALTWHREQVDTDPGAGFDPEPRPANLDLKLRNLDGGGLIDASLSAVDNVEHIYQPLLPPGRYALEVQADVDRTFGLALRGELEAMPEVLSVRYDTEMSRLMVRAEGTPGRTYQVEAAAGSEAWQPQGLVTFSSPQIEFPVDGVAPLSWCRLIPLP